MMLSVENAVIVPMALAVGACCEEVLSKTVPKLHPMLVPPLVGDVVVPVEEDAGVTGVCDTRDDCADAIAGEYLIDARLPFTQVILTGSPMTKRPALACSFAGIVQAIRPIAILVTPSFAISPVMEVRIAVAPGLAAATGTAMRTVASPSRTLCTTRSMDLSLRQCAPMMPDSHALYGRARALPIVAKALSLALWDRDTRAPWGGASSQDFTIR